MGVAQKGRGAAGWGVGAIVIDRRSRIQCCTASRPAGFAQWPVEPGRFLDQTETEFDEGFYVALAADRLAARREALVKTRTRDGAPVDVHVLPIILPAEDETGFLLMIAAEPDEGLQHSVGNILAEIRAVVLASQRGAKRIDHLAFLLCRRIDVLLALALLRHRHADGRVPLGDVIAAGAPDGADFTGPADFKLLNEQAKAVALIVSDWCDAHDLSGAPVLAARTSDVLELAWTGPAPQDEGDAESELTRRILSRVDDWLTNERNGDALVRRLFIPIQ